MASFLAYFDLLGYKKFIEKNNKDHLNYRTNHFGRNIEMALSLDHPPIIGERSGNLIPDISHSTLNCLTFSDTVILWTNSNEIKDFEEILEVAYKYNSFNILHDFPSRGCIVYGDIWYKPFDSENLRGGRYMLNMIYGQALINAHLRAEAMSWAGCELDNSAIEYAQSLGNIDHLLQKYTMVYDIPFKKKENGQEIEVKIKGYAIRLNTDSILISEFLEDGIRSAFTQDNKGEIEGRTKVIFDNTIDFLRAHKIILPFYYRITPNSEVQIIGKLDADFTHTTIKIPLGDAIAEKPSIEIVKLDRDEINPDIFEGELITKDVYDKKLYEIQNA